MGPIPTILGPPTSARRKLLALAILLLALLLVRLIWGFWSERKLQAALDALRTRGEVVAAADVVYAIVPDDQNAWLLQQKAGQSVVPNSPKHSAMEYPRYPPYSAQWMNLASASETANAASFALARQARQLSRAQFHTSLPSPVANLQLRYLSIAKVLANTLGDGIAYAHVTGDDHEALERSLDLLHLARSLHHDDFIVSQLVAIGIDSLACAEIQSIAPGLRLDGASATRPATLQQVRRLIDVLLDEREARQGIIRSALIERIEWMDARYTWAQGTWLIRPLADRAIARGLSNFDLLREAYSTDNMPAARRILGGWFFKGQAAMRPVFPGAGSSPSNMAPRYSRWFDGYNMAAEAVIERHFRVIAERRATAASLACQLFRAQHGRWPERLEELSPTYLPRVPLDPFFKERRTIQYVVYHGALPDGGDRPMLVWYAAQMDYGPRAEPTYGWYHDERRQVGAMPWTPVENRQYRDVSRFQPAPAPPSTQAVQDNPQKADPPRQQQQPDDQPQ